MRLLTVSTSALVCVGDLEPNTSGKFDACVIGAVKVPEMMFKNHSMTFPRKDLLAVISENVFARARRG